MKYTLPPLLIVIAIAPLCAFAAESGIWKGVYCNEVGKGPCTFCEMIKVASNVVEVLRNFAFGIGVLAIVAGAILMMISAGNAKKFQTGKSFIVNAIIGIVIALTAWLIINTLLSVIAGDATLPWNEIECPINPVQ